MKYTFKTLTFSVAHEPTTSLVSKVKETKDLIPFLKGIFQECDADKEAFAVLFLDARSNIFGFKIVSVGTLSETLVHPREVFRPAIEASAFSIIVAHTHPSQDVTPSDEDIDITLRLFEAGRLLGVPLLDHIVMASGISPDSAWRSIALGKMQKE